MENYFLEYWTKIDNGEIVACEKIKKICKQLLDTYYNSSKYHFDLKIAQRHIDFIEKFCTLDDGKGGSTPIQLTLFQKAFLQTIYGFVDSNGYRKFTEVMLVMGRKNGKTALVSCMELDLLMNDNEPSPQVYNIAVSKDQAMKGWDKCYSMVKRNKGLSKHVKKKAGAHLHYDFNDGYIKALASNVNALDGLDCHGAVLDEMGAYKKRDVYDLITQSVGARKQPLIVTITTNGFVRNNIFDAQYEYSQKVLDGIATNEHFLPLLYELDDESEYTDEICWIKANPTLGEIKTYDYLREKVQKALDDPSYVDTLMVKDFDMPRTGESAWLQYADIINDEKMTIEQLVKEGCKYFVGAFDGADKIDLNSAVALFKRPKDNKYYAFPMFWIPESVIEEEQKKGNRKGRDSVPYELYIKQGFMRTCPGNKCDKSIFLDWFKELKKKYNINCTLAGFDPWHIDDTTRKDLAGFVGNKRIFEIRQGVKTLSEPLKNLKADFQAHNIVYNDNPLLKWCLYNARIKKDINENIQLIKSSDRTQRIDGCIALVCAYIILNDNENIYLNLNKVRPETVKIETAKPET